MKFEANVSIPKWLVAVPFIAMAVLLVVWTQKSDGKLHVWVLDVGQGNAILVRTPKGHTALIDGGPAATLLNEKLGRNIPFWQNNLDLVVLTSPDSENISGLVDLLGRRKVAQIVQPDFQPTTSIQGAWREKAAQSGAQLYSAHRGDSLGFADEPDVILRVLYPAGKGGAEISSLVLKLEYNGINILLAQNLEKTDEARLLGIAEAGELASDALIVPDHGNEDALSAAFLEAVQPKVAIISVGQGNRSNDPDPATIQQLLSAGALIYRTDTEGDIHMYVDKQQLWVAAEK